MNEPFFPDVGPIPHLGPDTDEPLAYRWWQPDRVVAGRTMAEHLRPAVCYWHSFNWPGDDVFGSGTFDRPWLAADGDPMAHARHKMAAAFELIEKLGVPYFCFHDRDLAPAGATFAESCDNLDVLVDEAAAHMARTGVGLLWGTANVFSHPRFAAGAATNPNPEVFAHAAAQVAHALDATHRLGGLGYVMWGGREGYETLLNTDLKRELAQFGRFLQLVVEHKHKIGFKGAILIEPKPAEPTKHQYDYDVATVFGFLKAHGLEKEVKVNIEQNHALLAGHTFEHEISLAQALGIFGSIDMNRGDEMLGWDTDQFPNNLPQVALALYHVLQGGGFTSGGLNFDAKLRRQSIDPDDLIAGHAHAMDLCARALLVAEKMIEDGALARQVEERYAGWDGKLGRAILQGKRSLADLAAVVEKSSLEPQPVSGRQERLEALVNSYL